MSYVPTMKNTTSRDKGDTSTFTNEGAMDDDDPVVRNKQAVAAFRGPRNTSSVYSSSSSTSFNSSGELQYVDPDGGEPVTDEYYHSQTQQQQQLSERKDLSSSATALHQQQQQQQQEEETVRSPEAEHCNHQERESQGRNAFSRRRNPEPEEDDTMAVDSKCSGDKAPSSHERILQELDPPDPPNFYQRDMEFEVQLLSLRNKRVLIARLNEVVPRGRLSMVRIWLASYSNPFCSGPLFSLSLLAVSVYFFRLI